MKFDKAFMIGRCQIIPIEYAIKFNGDEKQSVQPKFIEVLCYLAEHFPRVIPREELIENVWAGNHYVGEKALTNAIWHLRQILKGAQNSDEVIETIRKVGYRLLIEPKLTEEPILSPTSSVEQTKPPRVFSKFYGIFATFSLLLLWLSFQFINDSQKIAQHQITQITKEPGSELFVSPSPDGRYVVYKWLTAGRAGNLYIHDTTQPELPAKQLTFNNDSKGSSAWSNDGEFLFFTQKNATKGYCDVVQLKVSSKQIKKLANCPINIGYSYIDISPDDKTLAFLGYSEPADDHGIYFISLTEDNAKPYRFSCANNCGYKDRDFAFSPDGKSIAVTRRVNRFNENIYLVNLATNEAQQLTSGEEDIVGLTWHPSGKKLIFGAQRADMRNGYVLDINTKEVSPLNIAGFSYPAYAKKSGQLYYQQRNEKYHIASLPIDQTIATSPFPVIQSDFNHHYPDYSAIAKKVVYVSNESGYYELWSANANGSNRKQLTNLKKSIRYPKWSHDGTRVAFLAPLDDDKSDKIYILDINSLSLSIVPSPFNAHNRPTWSFDDKSIISAIYKHEYTDLHQISIEDGSATRITFDGARYGIMISETLMLYTRIKNGLWLKNVNNDNPPLNQISGKDFNATYTWTYHDNKVYFRHNTSKNHHVAYYDLKQQKEFPIARLPLSSSESFGTLTYLAKSATLLFAASQYPQSDIKMLEHSLTH